MPSAQFRINGFTIPPNVAVNPGDSVGCALVSSVGVRSVTWSIVGSHDPDVANPVITPTGSPATSMNFIMPNIGGGQAYLIRCEINGGRDDSNQVVAAYAAQGVCGVLGSAGIMPIAANETLERHATHGYTKDLNRLTQVAEDWKTSVAAATAAALPTYTRSGNVLTATANGAMPAVDGVALAVSNRFLLKDGGNAADNGIYTVTSLGSGGSPWVATRATDADTSAEVTSGMRVPVTMGATFGNRMFRLATADPIILNSTSLTFVLDTGLPSGSATTDTIQWNGSTWVATSNPTFVTATVTSATATSFIAIGSVPATTGALRVAHGSVFYGRRSDNGANLNFADWGSLVADSPTWGADGISNVYVRAGGSIQLGISGVNIQIIEAAQITIQAPILRWSASVTIPSISQMQQNGDVAPNAMTISAQAASATSTGGNRTGANLKLAGGAKNTGGQDGRVQVYAGSTFVADIRVLAGISAMYFSELVGASIGNYDPTSDLAPQTFNISAANAFASASTNINGAFIEMTPGGRKSGSAGLSGGLRVMLNFAETMIEAAEVATGRRVVVLNRMNNITTTELPANTGDGVVYLGNVVTAPTASPVSGGIAWAASGALRWREPNGEVTQPTYRGISTGGTTKLLDRIADDLQTANATVTTILSYTVPDNSVIQVVVHVCARNQTAAEQAAYFVRHAAKRRAAGSAALAGTIAKDSFEDDATWDVTTAVSGNDFLVQVTGEAANTIDWHAWMDVYLWTP